MEILLNLLKFACLVPLHVPTIYSISRFYYNLNQSQRRYFTIAESKIEHPIWLPVGATSFIVEMLSKNVGKQFKGHLYSANCS